MNSIESGLVDEVLFESERLSQQDLDLDPLNVTSAPIHDRSSQALMKEAKRVVRSVLKRAAVEVGQDLGHNIIISFEKM